MWAKLHRLVLDELGSRGELDWSRCAIDSVNMRAPKKGAWLSGCRRLHRRHGCKAERFLAFAGIAATLICYRRLAA